MDAAGLITLGVLYDSAMMQAHVAIVRQNNINGATIDMACKLDYQPPSKSFTIAFFVLCQQKSVNDRQRLETAGTYGKYKAKNYRCWF